jgi:pimeloyl-ACP methyl ester carboxylesterase
MLAVAAAGYHTIAPDYRGYGLSDQPPEHREASWDDLVADVLGILDALSIPKVPQPVEHPRISPWPRDGAESHTRAGVRGGRTSAYDFSLRHPDRTCGVVCLAGCPLEPSDHHSTP